MKKIRVSVSQLLPGDKLVFGRTIAQVYNQGLSIPSGKSEVHVIDKHGNKTLRYWNKRTTMLIERECCAR